MTEQWVSALWQRFKDHYGQKWMGLFQGPEAIESWRITWASLDVEASQIKFALSCLATDFPDWPPTFGQFKALCGRLPLDNLLPAPVVERVQPSPETLEKFRAAAANMGRPKRFWVPENVVNSSQVNFIVLQAQHFGPMSAAGRFLDECKAAGVIGE